MGDEVDIGPCPGEVKVALYALGMLPVVEFRYLMRHFARCELCRKDLRVTFDLLDELIAVTSKGDQLT